MASTLVWELEDGYDASSGASLVALNQVRRRVPGMCAGTCVGRPETGVPPAAVPARVSAHRERWRWCQGQRVNALCFAAAVSYHVAMRCLGADT